VKLVSKKPPQDFVSGFVKPIMILIFILIIEFVPNHLNWVLIVNVAYGDKPREVIDQIDNHVEAIVGNYKVKRGVASTYGERPHSPSLPIPKQALTYFSFSQTALTN
jgi:hypothetical protein